MSPKFSIVIPVYNVEQYLRECLDSVLSQTFTDWEAVCVDDGSTDRSGLILDEYAGKDRRFRVIHQTNGGVSVARNTALENVRGEWITFVDADDRIASWRLEYLHSIILRHPEVDWIKETRYLTHSSSINYLQEDRGVNRIVPKCDVFLYTWETQKNNALLCLNSYKFEKIRLLRFPKGVRYAEDDIFELSTATYVTSCAEVRYGGYWYRDDRADAASRHISVSDSVKIHQHLLRLIEEQNKTILELNKPSNFNKVFTETVRKDFGRVFRSWLSTPVEIRREHIKISRLIFRSPYFDSRYAGYCRFGYRIYMQTGVMLCMLVEDVLRRRISKIRRMLFC